MAVCNTVLNVTSMSENVIPFSIIDLFK